MELPVSQWNARREARRRAAWADPPGGRVQQPRFPRFAAAMDEARTRKSPLLTSYHVAPVVRGAGARQGPARRPLARWLGIGSGVLLLGVLVATMFSQPIGAAYERLIGSRLEWLQDWPLADSFSARPTPEAPATPDDR